MAHDDGGWCDCVAEHRPPVLEYQRHHLWPLYLGGPDTPSNTIWLCSTTHDNVHELMRLMLRAGRTLTYRECQHMEDRPVSHYAWQLTVRGLNDYIDATENQGA